MIIICLTWEVKLNAHVGMKWTDKAPEELGGKGEAEVEEQVEGEGLDGNMEQKEYGREDDKGLTTPDKLTLPLRECR